MAAQTPIAGTCYLQVDGTPYELQGNWKVQPNSIKREGVVGMSGPLGPKETPVHPEISGEISDSGGLSVQQLQKIIDSTVTLELINGKVYILPRAWWADTSDIDCAEGKIPAKFQARTCRELLAS